MSPACALRGLYSGHRLAFSRISTCQQSIRPCSRPFTASPCRLKDSSHVRTVQPETKVPTAESTKSSSMEKQNVSISAKQPPTLLGEQTVSNKDQRKADWAIIKDMARYLWPKDDFGTRFRVSLSVALLIGAKVAIVSICLVSCCHVDDSKGSECSSPLLFQIHCRLDEHRLCCCRWYCCHGRWCNHLRL
jgi:ATP-binding cassette subfamily B (MDR/TAP) protein 7